jgi:hypothetical protein
MIPGIFPFQIPGTSDFMDTEYFSEGAFLDKLASRRHLH